MTFGRETHVKTIISSRQLSTNVILWDRFLGVKTESKGSGLAQSRVLGQKVPPVSPTDMMKFANFFLK